jgi:type IV pilus assembly protein PilQ
MSVLLFGEARSATGNDADARPTEGHINRDTAAPTDERNDTLEIDTHAIQLQAIVDTSVVVPRLDFSNTKLSDALTALARAYNMTVYIDSSVAGSISLRLEDVSLNDALLFIIKEHGLSWEKTGGIIKIFRPLPEVPEPEPLDISFQNGKLSADLDRADLADLVDTLIDITSRNIIVENGVHGHVSGRIAELDFTRALETLLTTNGFDFRQVDEIIFIGTPESQEVGEGMSRNLAVRCSNGLVSVEIVRGSLASTVSTLARQCGVSVVVQTELQGAVTASFRSRTVEDAFVSLLTGSPYTFKLADSICYIGDRDSQDLYDTKLLALNNLKASVVSSLIPVSLAGQAAIQVVKEHNGILVTGPRTSISRIEQFIEEVDVPAAQVLFEVLVVDYTSTERAEFRITADNYGGGIRRPGETYYPEIDINANGDEADYSLRSLERRLNISNLGTVGDDFFVRLRMLQQEGKANIRSHPQIATLNGYTASLKIGTSQYYLLESKTVYPSQQSEVSTQTSQRFEIIEADMSLEVTPYVSPGGELTVDVKPEFSTPSGSFDPEVPPTINKRVLESTVRLKSGETIVLGGLVQNTESVQIDKLPLLGSLPLIGRLFQNRSSSKTQSELMIYITPYVYFGSGNAVNVDSLLVVK